MCGYGDTLYIYNNTKPGHPILDLLKDMVDTHLHQRVAFQPYPPLHHLLLLLYHHLLQPHNHNNFSLHQHHLPELHLSLIIYLVVMMQMIHLERLFKMTHFVVMLTQTQVVDLI